MLPKLILLRDEIEEELASVKQLQKHIQDIKGQNLDPEIMKRVCASILSDFYMAAERIFKLIAKEIDEELPDGEDWHKKLLRQMSVEMPEIRPAVIDKELFHSLDGYLKFRHLVRNIYGFQLDLKRFEHLIENMVKVVKDLENQIFSFLDKMEDIAKDIYEDSGTDTHKE